MRAARDKDAYIVWAETTEENEAVRAIQDLVWNSDAEEETKNDHGMMGDLNFCAVPFAKEIEA